MKIDPRYLEACVDLAAGLHAINPVRYSESILALTTLALASNVDNIRARKLAAATHLVLAQRAIDVEDWAQAATLLRQSFALDALDLTLEMLEFCAERSGHLRDVVAACEQRVREVPSDLRSTFVLGRLCVRLAGERASDSQQLLLRAETTLNRVLEFSESHVEAWYWLGAAFVLAGRDRDARTIVEVLEPLDGGRSYDLEQLRRDAVAHRSSPSTTD